MRKEGIEITPPYINEARFGFKPDAENNRIIYGLKAVNGVGATQANAIVKYQPYTSMTDFYEKMKQAKNEIEGFSFGDKAMFQLIKSGAFDKLESTKTRTEVMAEFINTYKLKKTTKLTFKNIEEVNNLGLLTEAQKKNELRYYKFKNYLYNFEPVRKDGKSPATYFYPLTTPKAQQFFYEHFEALMTEGKDYCQTEENDIIVKRGSLDKVIDKLTADFQTNVLNSKEVLDKYNEIKFQEIWNKECSGSIERWEMESLNVYNTRHELEDVDKKRYNIVDFDTLPEEPIIEKMNGKWYRYKLSRIVGTVIDKDANHCTVTLLTPSGVATVRLYKGQFNFYARDIVDKDSEGNKYTVEGSWFKRGSMILVTGFRSSENFIPKVYKDSAFSRHTVQKVLGLNEDGSLITISERAEEDREEAQALAI